MQFHIYKCLSWLVDIAKGVEKKKSGKKVANEWNFGAKLTIVNHFVQKNFNNSRAYCCLLTKVKRNALHLFCPMVTTRVCRIYGKYRHFELKSTFFLNFLFIDVVVV